MGDQTDQGSYGSLEKDKKLHFWRRPALRQSFVIIGLICLMFSAGIGLGTATVMMPQLKKNKELVVDDDMASWIYSAHGIGSVPAVIIIPYLSQWKGYKMAFMLLCIPSITSFILLYFAVSAYQILIATICQGVTMGGNLTLGIVAISEFADPRLRSLFLVLKSATYFWGILIANTIGTFSSWRLIPLIGIVPPLFSFCSCFLWPEGPYWLASKGRISECQKSFQWLRGPGNDTEELSSIIQNHTTKQNVLREKNIWIIMRKAIILRQFYMPLMINCVSCSLYYFTGKIVCAVYAIVIIKQITEDEFTAYTGMLIMDVVTVIGMYVGSYVALKVQRRVMYLTTSAVTIFFLYSLFVYLSLVEYKIVVQNKIVSLSLLVIYSLSVSWGPMVLCTATISEISPMRFKAPIVAICCFVFFASHITILKVAPVLFRNIGMHGSFGLFGTLTLIDWLILYKYLPETSNKTLQELELYFVKKKDENTQENVKMLQASS